MSALESRYDLLGWWLAFSTLVVVIGLVLEYWHDLKKLVRAPWKRKLKLLGGFIGGVLITAGVTGELLIQSKLSGVETDLRNANKLTVAGLEG